MDVFFENSWKFLILGGLIEIGLIALLVKSGRGMWIYVMAAVALLTGGLVCLERLVVTPREQVEKALYAAAAAVESNNLNAVLDTISPTAKEMRADLRARLPNYKIDRVSIKSDLAITVNDLTAPPTARAEFHVVVTGGDRAGNFHDMSYPIFLTVYFERQGDRWLMSGYDEPHGLR
ncbi:MAG TPA: hypothetical protein VFE24_14085 [Pirellulales bacterium]|jgi:hypothetical protein|nr:hypothetical protein [Pirellulales bacterium]